MDSSRRTFLKQSMFAAAIFNMPRFLENQTAKKAEGKTLLILGGTAFLGPEIVEAAKEKGYTITLFNRGKTNPQLFPELEKLHGDRKNDLKALEGRKWDAVVDTSGYVPRHVRDSATLLKDAVKHYVFISTISVYADTSKPGTDENSAVGKLEDPNTEKVTELTYGPMKALCEQEAEKAMPGRVTNIRPGLIVGPGDPTDRFSYWPVRVSRGGEVLAPGTPNDPLQYIDVRDLAEWTVHTLEKKIFGVYNAVGPKEGMPIGKLLESCKKVSGSNASFTWVDAKFLEEQNVTPWGDMPVWVGNSEGDSRISFSKAVANGLSFRPVDVTVKDFLAWWKEQPEERQKKLRSGITPEREAAVLAAWKAKKG